MQSFIREKLILETVFKGDLQNGDHERDWLYIYSDGGFTSLARGISPIH